MTDRRAALEAAIEAAPDDRATYEVYADELQRLGDPRGELIALQLRDPDDPRAQALLASPGIAIGPPILSARWRWGFVERAEVDPDLGTTGEQRAMLDHPSLRFVDSLWCEFSETRSQSIVDAIASRSRRCLTQLELGTLLDTEKPYTDRTSLDVGHLGELWRALPALTSLGITGQILSIGELALPKLEVLSIDAVTIRADVIAAVAAADWPHLAYVYLVFGHAVPDVEAVAHMLSRFPALRALEVAGNFLDELVEPLARLPSMRRLEKLRLYRGLTDRGAEALVNHADAFAHLGRLDVAHNYLSLDAVAQVTRIARDVRTDNQQEPYDRDSDLYDY